MCVCVGGVFRQGLAIKKIARTTKEIKKKKKKSQDHIEVKAETGRILFQDM